MRKTIEIKITYEFISVLKHLLIWMTFSPIPKFKHSVFTKEGIVDLIFTRD